MWKIAAGLAAMALVALVALNPGGGSLPASAGILPLPPGGLDDFDINAEFSIDLFGQGPEVVSLAGNMAVNRGEPDPTAGTIETEIVALSLTGTSNLLGPGTPIVVQLNEAVPALGQIGPAEGFPADSFFDVFFDIKIGEFQHYTGQPTHLSGLYSGVPPYDSKWLSGPTENPIVDATEPTNIPGFLVDATIWGKPPEKSYTITVLKQHDDTKAGLPGWQMNIYAGRDCNGSPFDSVVTDENGIADFAGLAAGTYSVEEKMQAGWNNVTPLCQDTTVPGGAGGAGVPACPIQPDLPPPDAGCDEFNSAASVTVQFTNPPSDPLDCDLGGPTLITRSAVLDSDGDNLDDIQTEIVAMNLTGTCGGAANVTLRESPDLASTGKITEQQNDVPGELDFSADSFFDVFFDVDTPIGTLHNQDPLRLECKINEIPPYGCVYEPDIGSIILYDATGKEVAKLIHAAHIPLDPKQKLLIFVNAPKPTPTPPPTLNPDFAEKIDVCIDAQVIGNPGAAPIWTKAQIDALVDGADELWAQANINITWNNNITDIDDPSPPPPGQVGDIIDTFKDDTEFLALGTNNPNSAGKEKCVRIFFIRHFIDNDGNQFETADGDTTLAEVDDKGRGHYVVVGLKSKDNAQTFAHELGHIFGLQHEDTKDNNLMSSLKEPENSLLNKDQMRAARTGAAEISAQPTATPEPGVTPTPGDVTPTPATDPTDTPTPRPTDTPTPADDTPTPTDEPGGDGDTNKDGTVDSRDALLILQSVVGLIGTPPNADVNRDGTVNSLDAVLVLQRVVGLLLSLPV